MQYIKIFKNNLQEHIIFVKYDNVIYQSSVLDTIFQSNLITWSQLENAILAGITSSNNPDIKYKTKCIVKPARLNISLTIYKLAVVCITENHTFTLDEKPCNLEYTNYLKKAKFKNDCNMPILYPYSNIVIYHVNSDYVIFMNSILDKHTPYINYIQIQQDNVLSTSYKITLYVNTIQMTNNKYIVFNNIDEFNEFCMRYNGGANSYLIVADNADFVLIKVI